MPHLENPMGEDNAFDQRDDGLRQEAWEQIVSDALDEGETDFSVSFNVTWEDQFGWHTDTILKEFTADSLAAFWEAYYDAARDIIDALGDYEDGAVTAA